MHPGGNVMIVSRSASGVALRRIEEDSSMMIASQNAAESKPLVNLILDVKTYLYNSQQDSKLLIWLGLDLVALATIRYNKDNNYV
jgi:hypothetical protein